MIVKYSRKKILFAIITLLSATRLMAQDTVHVNSAVTYQTIKGWVGAGGENTQFEGTPPYMITQDINESVNGVGFTGLRDDMYQGNYSHSYGQQHTWEWTNDNGSPDTVTESAFDSGAIDYYYNNLIVPWRNAVVGNGDSFLFYMSPSWYYGGSTGDIPAFLRYSPGEYAEYYISYMNHIKNQYGLIPNYITMCNEAGNGNAFYELLVANMIKTVMPRVQAAGYTNTWCQYPECVSTQQSWQYIDSGLLDPGIWPYIKCLSFHKYGTNDPYRHDIDSLATLKGIISAQTEEQGEGISEVYNDITLAGVSYWQAYAIGDYCVPNANNTWYTHGAKYWTFRQLMHYVRPGAVRIAAVSNDTPAIVSLAFNQGGNITTLILNNNAASIATTVTIAGLPAGNYAVSQVLGSGSPYTEFGVYTVGGSGTLTLPLANQAIMTVYPHTANLPVVPETWAATPTYLDLPASSVALTSSGLDPELSTVTYHWTIDSFPAGAAVVLSNPNIAAPTATGMTVAGNYVFTIHMADGSTDTTKRSVTVEVFPNNQAPIISALQSRNPTIVTLPVDTSIIHGFAFDIEGDALTYSYSIISQPIGATAALRNISINVQDIYNMTLPGNYVVQLSVTDPSHVGSPSIRNITIPVYPVNDTPVISSVSATPAVMSLPVDSSLLSAVTSDPDGDIITHWWTVKSAPAGANPTFSMQGERINEAQNLTVPGRYIFLLTLIDRTLYTTKVDTVVVNLNNTSVCVGATTSLSDPVTGGLWVSSNPAVATVGSSSGTITGATVGTTTISYTVAGFTVTGTVTVNVAPAAGSITGTGTLCTTTTTNLTDATGGGTWSSVSTGIATVGSTGIVTGVAVGTSTISYTVSNSCGMAAATTIVTVSTTPSAGTITGVDLVCPTATTNLTDATGGGAWSSVSTGIATVGSTGVVTGVAAGTSIISYTVSNSCGIAAATTIVTVSTTPSAGTITGVGLVCPTATTNLTDATGGGTWSSVSTGIATVGSTGVVTGVAVGTSIISYTVSNSCGIAAATTIVTVSTTPSAGTITGVDLVCPTATTNLTDATGGGTWSSVSTGIATVGSTGIVTGVTVGTSTISYTVSNSCGMAAATAIMTVSATPSAGTITGVDLVCPTAITNLTDATGGGTWSSVSTGIATVGSTGVVTGAAVGTSTISYTVSNSCGIAAATAIVTVSAAPSAGTITGVGLVCPTATTNLTDAIGGGAWSSVSTGIATVGSTGVVTGVAVGTSTISYTVVNSCGTAAATAIVTVNAAPDAGTIAGIDTVCTSSITALSDGAAGGTWSSSNTTVASVNTTGTVSGLSAGTSTISYSLTNSCGTAVATEVVTVDPCSTGINIVDNTAGVLTIFPNPAASSLTITYSSIINQVTITDLFGQKVYSNIYNANEVRVDVSKLAGGLYFVKVNGVETRKFVKE